MNKDSYLNELEQRLKPLSAEDRAEILEDYTLLIDEKLSTGLSEEEVILGLHSPEKVASEYISELLGDARQSESKFCIRNNTSKSSNLLLFILLQCFNLLIGVWIAFSIGMTAFSLVISGGAVASSSILSLFQLAHISFASRIFTSFVLAGVGILILNIGLLIAYWTFIGLRKYIRWNISLLK